MKKFALLMLCSILTIQSKVEIIEKGLSYDDVLLVPQKSTVSSRRQANTKTRLTKNIELNIPIVSSNMDSVTESKMAIAMAQIGGIGIIHRFNSIEQQVEEVKRVKRYRNAVIYEPFQISEHATIADVLDCMHEKQISGLLVTNHEHKLTGIITKKDINGCDEKKLVTECMTPREQLIVGKADISIAQAEELLTTHKLEKLPLVHDDGTIAGLITKKDINVKIEYPNAALDARGQLLVGAAIGVKAEDVERARALVAAGADVLVIDIAHGHSDLAIAILKALKEQFPHVDVIAGNVATAQGTRELIEAGADAVKVGIGPGSICTTRIVAGSGYPQLSAVINCAQEADKYNVPIIADGGVKYSGDLVKAIAAGASTVMLGSLLAGTDESPGLPFVKNGKKFKIIRGMASLGANIGRNQRINRKDNSATYVPEGVEAIIPYKGSVIEIVYQLIGGLHSGMSYCGVISINELRGNGIFVEITAAGIRESHPHDVQQMAN